eukprot:TRINITY_DN62423_c0_g1_i1.p1 TRINITY_DN62423_c0_g1~~TRINITY_DN62423_c0_g1_i1.p1  ORF type:complete len:798 (-),score=163.33 TRINITY_DN62423_c0_g1_i1:194-2587(-)
MASAGSNKDTISKNNLEIAKNAVKRFPVHKQLITKFIRTFESRVGSPDPKFGFLKYKALLRAAVNRNIDTVVIDLEDVHEFCKKELQDPTLQGDISASAAGEEMQYAITRLLDDVEQNTTKYERFFYTSCIEEKPERDDGFNRDNADTAAETTMQWREDKIKKMTEQGQPAGEIPHQLKNHFNVAFKPRDAARTFRFREVTADFVGSLVQLDCLVVRASEVKPKVDVVTYQCEICDGEIFQTVESETFKPPTDCPSQRCKERKQGGKLRQQTRTSKFSKHQEIRVQEMSEHVPVGGVPRSITAVLKADLCRTIAPGDAITLTGVYTPAQLPWFLMAKKGTTQDMFIAAHHIRKHKRGYNEQSHDEVKACADIDEAVKQGNMYEKAAKSIAPQIFGMLDVKKALLLSLIGGFTKQMKDGMKIRGEIHTLFMGDPGVAKSQLLKQVCNIAPRSVYTTGKGTSGVGLTASVIRDKLTSEVTLEGGALVLADKGVCCIDEFDKMDEQDRTAIHEVMEQQSVSIAKAGITTMLNTRTTIMAGANPTFGRYNPFKSPIDNIDLPASLLSRFDLIFLLLDTVDQDKDAKLARHVCKVHSTYQAMEAKKADKDDAGDEGDVLDMGFKPFDSNLMRSYVRRAKEFEPMVVDSLQKPIVDAYVSLRDDEKRPEMDAKKSYTTPRTLLAILRLSQAHARARFSDKVEQQDFDEAMRIMKASKESVEVSSPAKRGVNPLDVVHDIVADLSRRSDDNDGWVSVADVTSMGGHKAMSREAVIEAIENWETYSVLSFNPEKTKVRFLVPAPS